MEELSFKKLLNTFRQYWQHCLIIVIGIVSSVIIYTLCIPKAYVASATIMGGEDKSSAGATSALGQLVGLTSSSNNDFRQFMAIVSSRSFKEQLVDSLGTTFFDVPNKQSLSEQQIKDRSVGLLGSAIKLRIEPDFSNVLIITVQMSDPKRPPIVTNQLLSVLQNYIQNNSLTRAKRFRQYMENNILETKISLFETANEISSFYNRYPVNQAKGVIETPFQKEIGALSVDGQKDESVNSFPKESLTLLKAKRGELLKRFQNVSQTSEQTYFDYLKDEYNILKNVNFLLRQQYEMAKLEEIKEEPFFQIVDRAKGSSLNRPNLFQTGVASFLVSLLISMAYLLFRTFYHSPQKTKARFHLEGAQVTS